jgi:RNA polymerase sigma-70 factor, ECF subfamily
LSRLRDVAEPTTDPALITAAAGGDTDALTRVVREFAPSVFAFLSGMLGDQREAEEGMQETFVRAARGVERYSADVAVEAWIFQIARRVAADIRPTPASPLGEAPPAQGDVQEWAKRSLRALPLELREVVVLKELLRWKPERIAAALTCDPTEVSHRLLEARTKLAENMRGSS